MASNRGRDHRGCRVARQPRSNYQGSEQELRKASHRPRALGNNSGHKRMHRVADGCSRCDSHITPQYDLCRSRRSGELAATVFGAERVVQQESSEVVPVSRRVRNTVPQNCTMPKEFAGTAGTDRSMRTAIRHRPPVCSDGIQWTGRSEEGHTKGAGSCWHRY